MVLHNTPEGLFLLTEISGFPVSASMVRSQFRPDGSQRHRSHPHNFSRSANLRMPHTRSPRSQPPAPHSASVFPLYGLLHSLHCHCRSQSMSSSNSPCHPDRSLSVNSRNGNRNYCQSLGLMQLVFHTALLSQYRNPQHSSVPLFSEMKSLSALQVSQRSVHSHMPRRGTAHWKPCHFLPQCLQHAYHARMHPCSGRLRTAPAHSPALTPD